MLSYVSALETQTLMLLHDTEDCARLSSLETRAIELILQHNVQNCLNSRLITFSHNLI